MIADRFTPKEAIEWIAPFVSNKREMEGARRFIEDSATVTIESVIGSKVVFFKITDMRTAQSIYVERKV